MPLLAHSMQGRQLACECLSRVAARTGLASQRPQSASIGQQDLCRCEDVKRQEAAAEAAACTFSPRINPRRCSGGGACGAQLRGAAAGAARAGDGAAAGAAAEVLGSGLLQRGRGWRGGGALAGPPTCSGGADGAAPPCPGAGGPGQPGAWRADRRGPDARRLESRGTSGRGADDPREPRTRPGSARAPAHAADSAGPAPSPGADAGAAPPPPRTPDVAARLYCDAMAMLRRHQAAAERAAQARSRTAVSRCALRQRTAVAMNERKGAHVVEPSTLFVGVLPGHAVHLNLKKWKQFR